MDFKEEVIVWSRNYPELVGLPKEPTVDEIVDLAINGV